MLQAYDESANIPLRYSRVPASSAMENPMYQYTTQS
jgi:hypothetical protein